MAKQITDYVNEILTEKRLKDMRDAIAQGISRTYEDAIKEGNANMEVSMARGVYDRLKDRLDASDDKLTSATAQLAQKVGGNVRAGLNNMGPDVLAAIEGGEGTEFNLLSEPADNSVSTIKVVDKNITEEKTNFIEVSPNKFDKNNLIAGFALDATSGEPIANATYLISRYFEPITPGADYIFNVANITQGGPLRAIIYDDNFLRIGQIAISASAGSAQQVVSAPARFVRFSVHQSADLDTLQFREGSQASEYVPYYKRLRDNIDLPGMTDEEEEWII